MVILNATGSANFINLNYKDTSVLSYLAAFLYPANNIIQMRLIQKKIIATVSSNKKETPYWKLYQTFKLT